LGIGIKHLCGKYYTLPERNNVIGRDGTTRDVCAACHPPAAERVRKGVRHKCIIMYRIKHDNTYAHNSCTAADYTFTRIMYTAAIPFITQPARQTKFVCSDAYACDDAAQTVTNTHRYRVFSPLLLRLLLCLCKYNCAYLCMFIIT